MTPSDAYEVRVARLEREVDKIQDADQQDVIVERLTQLTTRVNRMAVWAMSASGLLVAVMAILLTLLKLK